MQKNTVFEAKFLKIKMYQLQLKINTVFFWSVVYWRLEPILRKEIQELEDERSHEFDDLLQRLSCLYNSSFFNHPSKSTSLLRIITISNRSTFVGLRVMEIRFSTQQTSTELDFLKLVESVLAVRQSHQFNSIIKT